LAKAFYTSYTLKLVLLCCKNVPPLTEIGRQHGCNHHNSLKIFIGRCYLRGLPWSNNPYHHIQTGSITCDLCNVCQFRSNFQIASCIPPCICLGSQQNSPTHLPIFTFLRAILNDPFLLARKRDRIPLAHA
jgi:hypothetical protein